MWMVGVGAAALAATWTVGPTSPYTTIQAAIDAAASGDVIEVDAGLYGEALDLQGKDLVIRSTGGATSATISPPAGQAAVVYDGVGGALDGFTIVASGARAVEVEGGTPELSDLVILGAGASGLDGGAIRIVGGAPALSSIVAVDTIGQRGGAIYVSGGAVVTFDEIEITSSAASFGGGIYLLDAQMVGSGLTLISTESDYAGAGVYLERSSLDVDQIEIESALGRFSHGAGLYLVDSSLSAEGGAISRCMASERALGYDGGALWLDAGSSASLSRIDLVENAARNGGAIAVVGGAVSLERVDLSGNEALVSGGAVFASSSGSVTLSLATFDGNTGSDGGAAWLSSGSWLSDTDGSWTSNVATGSGGAIGMDGALSASFDGSELLANRSSGPGGAVWATNSAGGLWASGMLVTDNRSSSGDGGALAVGNGTPLSVSSSQFDRNRSLSGSGGALSVETFSGPSVVVLLDSSFIANVADRSGGALSISDSGPILIEDTSLIDNAAGDDGGGMFLSGVASAEVLRALLHGNTASGSGGGAREEGALAESRYENLSMTENEAGNGGGLSIGGSAEAEIKNCTFAGNAASLEGGHLHVSGGSVRLVNDIFAFASDGGGLWGDPTAAVGSDIFYGLVWANAGGDYRGSFVDPTGVSGNLSQDPLFRAFSIDGDDQNDDLKLSYGSPAVDQGDPSLSDVDGSRSDIGAWGGPSGFRIDLDHDGVYAHADCDDADPGRSPLVAEVPYDGIDQDCDTIDPTDLDGDGYDGGPDGLDCADLDALVHPGTVEIYYDGIDQDCDEASDFDRDRDGADALGFGGADCDDQNASIGPTSAEIWYDGTDQDCSGGSDYDQDGDGYDAIAFGGSDCDDVRATVFPGAPERCDHLDNDCDTDIDEEPVDPQTFWVDSDLDGYGDGSAPYSTCWPEIGLSLDNTDCNDEDGDIHPGAAEIWYDGVDQDCDDRDDDQDEDGFLAADDCDDLRPEAFPGAEELVNGLDDDCDGFAEDDDRDGDGLIDLHEWAIGTDASDPDSDDDSRLDGEEVPDPSEPSDSDSDALIDPLDEDDDGDFLLTRFELSVDTDNDGHAEVDVDGDKVMNHLDLDTDGDGLPDDFEGDKDLDNDGIYDFADYQGPLRGGGCSGCANVRPPGLGAIGVLLAALLARRSRALPWLALLPSAAHAQVEEGLNAYGLDLLATTADPRSGLRLVEGGQREVGSVVGVLIDQTSRPVVELLPDGPDPLIRDLTTGSVFLSITPLGRLSFDAVLPTHVYGSGTAGRFTTAGDLRLGGQVAIANRSRAIPGLSLLATAFVPTGDEGRYVGAPTAAGGAVLALSQRIGSFGWSLDLGARLAPTEERRGLPAGSGPVAGVGIHVAASERVAIFSEVVSDGALGFSLPALPIEATLGARTRGERGRFLTFAAAAGLTDAVSAASWRLMIGGGFGPEPRPEPEPELLPPPEPEPEPELPAEPIVIEVPLATLQDDRIVLREQVFFLEGKAEILPQSSPVLDAVRQVIVDHPEIEFLLIEGHTNHNGSASYNYTLSKRRADAVRTWLVAHGIERSRLLTEGFGFDRPLLPPDAPGALETNRRVEFVVLRPDEEPEEVERPEP